MIFSIYKVKNTFKERLPEIHMSMTDISFLFIFMPATLIAISLKPQYKKYALLLLSLFFYACGSPAYFSLFLISVIMNVCLAYLIQILNFKIRKYILAMGIVLNFGCLFYYKYFDFTVANLNLIFRTSFDAKNLLLPMGISFFTFKAISLLADVYSGKVILTKNPADSALYLSFFTQITSGPICRYNEFYSNTTDFQYGCYRFVLGFIKKALLANILSIITVEVFTMDLANSTPAILWLGSICYSLQLYYDFSGYSDMAIGIGELCGISCSENFNYPYMTGSVSEFWRRWHISLGSWFRDYIYIPLGGSRVKSKARLYLNLFVVWLLTGIWHGAKWKFIFWGLGYFVVISLEKTFSIPTKFKSKAGRILYRIFTLLFVNFQWVIFNSSGLYNGLRNIKRMFISSGGELANRRTAVLLQEYGIFIGAAILFAMPVIPILKSWLCQNSKLQRVGNIALTILLSFLFIWAISFVIAGQNNPFLYGNF